MFKWSPFPFLRFSLALASGILISHHFPKIWDQRFAAVYLLLFLFVLARALRGRSFFEQPMAAGVLGFVLIAYLGGLIYQLDEDRRWSSHYTRQVGVEAFKGQVVGEIKAAAVGWRFIAEVSQVVIGDRLVETSGQAQVYLATDSAHAPDKGDVFFARGSPQPFRSPGNPGQFDYGQYMARQYVYGQAFVDDEGFEIVGTETSRSIIAFSSRLRQSVLDDLRGYFRNDEAAQIAAALLLGVKEDLSDDLREAYATAGATHVLAVSGLHVGIVYLLLLQAFGRLKRLPYGKPLFVVVVVLCIWLYALTTGLSASVFRAATMFTILTLGEASGNDRNVFNTLGVAAFVLLLYRPGYLFDLGFQFSYLAVFGIVYLFPKVNALITVGHPWLAQAWNVSCVSLSAQLAVAPLSVYYFHQFPTYFLLTNLVVVIFAFLILIVGLPMIVLGSLVSILGQAIAMPLELLILGLNALIRGIEGLPGSAVTGVAISMGQVLLAYSFMGAVLWSLEYKRFVAFALGCLLLIGFALQSHGAAANKERRVAMMIYDVRDALAVDFQAGGRAQLVTDVVDKETVRRNVDPARLQWHYPPASEGWDHPERVWLCDSTICTYNWQGLRILQINSDWHNLDIVKGIEADVVIVSNNARITSDQWSRIAFDHLVFDGTNDYWYVRRQREMLQQHQVEPHFVREDGFWQLTLY